MSTALFPRFPYQPLPADARRAGRAISQCEAAHLAWQAQQHCHTEETLIEMEDDTTLRGTAMGHVCRIALLQQELEARAPAASARFNSFAEEHTWDLHEDVAWGRRRRRRRG